MSCWKLFWSFKTHKQTRSVQNPLPVDTTDVTKPASEKVSSGLRPATISAPPPFPPSSSAERPMLLPSSSTLGDLRPGGTPTPPPPYFSPKPSTKGPPVPLSLPSSGDFRLPGAVWPTNNPFWTLSEPKPWPALPLPPTDRERVWLAFEPFIARLAETYDRFNPEAVEAAFHNLTISVRVFACGRPDPGSALGTLLIDDELKNYTEDDRILFRIVLRAISINLATKIKEDDLQQSIARDKGLREILERLGLSLDKVKDVKDYLGMGLDDEIKLSCVSHTVCSSHEVPTDK